MAPTTVSPGNIVVPLSAIVDQLQGKLTSGEIDALLSAVLANRRQRVAPGDLITADLMNQMLADLDDLQTRVAILEGSSGGVVILGRDPAGDVTVLGKLTLLGSGFDADPAKNTVLLGSIPVTSFFPESNATRLAFQVPDSFTGLPKLVTAVVKTADGRTSNAESVRLLPKAEQPQGGNVVIFPTTPALGQIVVGNTYTLTWLVDGQTALPATYRLQLLFTDVTGASAAAWAGASTLVPSTDQQIVRGNPLTVTATVTVPAGATSAQLALQVQSTDGTMTRTSAPLAFVVGATPQVSDPRAKFTLPAVLGPFDSNGNPNPLRTAKISVSGTLMDGLQLKFGQTGDIPLDLFVTTQAGAAGDFAYSAEVESAAGKWQVMSVTPTADTAVAAGTTRKVTVKLKNTDTSSTSDVKYMVVRATHSPQGSGTSDYVSFIRFPVQGFTS
jgi:hypothetical protein